MGGGRKKGDRKEQGEVMVEGGKGGSKEEEREEVREERGSGERERKGGVNAGMSLTYTLLFSKRQLRTGNYVPTTYICT